MRRLKRGTQLLFLCAVCLLNSCTFFFPSSARLEEQPAIEVTPETPSSLAFVKRLQAREEKATHFMQQGALAAALLQWEILQALAPQSPEYRQQIMSVRALIAQKVQQHSQQGTEALERGDLSRARHEFLVVLGFDPAHQQAQGQLRALESRRLKSPNRPKVNRFFARE